MHSLIEQRTRASIVEVNQDYIQKCKITLKKKKSRLHALTY